MINFCYVIKKLFFKYYKKFIILFFPLILSLIVLYFSIPYQNGKEMIVFFILLSITKEILQPFMIIVYLGLYVIDRKNPFFIFYFLSFIFYFLSCIFYFLFFIQFLCIFYYLVAKIIHFMMVFYG